MTPSYDIAVVGAGIHGAGVAQAASAAGYSVVVLEKTAVAAETSSASSKLIHGGLRYLESGQIGLVRESLRERQRLSRIAPDLVRLAAFHIPIYRDTSRRPWKIRAGLALYALLGGLDKSVRFRSLPRAEWSNLDGLDIDGLQAVFQYLDAQTDDTALTHAVMRSAQTLGCELLCPANFLAAEWTGKNFELQYSVGGRELSCSAKTIVNAAGPWINEVLSGITPRQPALAFDFVQGSHVIFDGEMTRGNYFVEAPADRRVVFVMPWRGKTLVGTTETEFRGVAGRALASKAEIEYLTVVFRRYFPDRDARMVENFSGLRVLPAGVGPFSGRPRATMLVMSPTDRPRLATIAGGKLTGYRLTAARLMRQLKTELPPRARRGTTENIMLFPVDHP